MKLSEILMLDCREEEKMRQLRKCLLRIPAIINLNKEWNKITTDDLDKIVYKYVKKYPITIGYINLVESDVTHYSIMIKEKGTHEWLKTVYSISLFEGFAKSLLFIYAYVKKIQEKEIEE